MQATYVVANFRKQQLCVCVSRSRRNMKRC